MHCFTKSWEQSYKRKTTVFLLEMKTRGFQWASYLPRDIKLVNGEAEFKSRSSWFQTPNSTALLHCFRPGTPLHAASRKAWLLPSLHELLEARGTFWHAEGQLWHWNPTSANGRAFTHSKKHSSPWWESFQWLQLQNSHSSLTPDAHEGSFIVLYVKNEERARTSALGKWWKIEKYLRHQGEEVVMSTKGNHGYEFQGIETLSTQLIPTDVGWISLWWPNSALWKPCQPPAGQFVLILHTLLALLLEPQIEDPRRASPNLTWVDTAWLISQQNSENRTGLRRQFYFGALDFKQIK